MNLIPSKDINLIKNALEKTYKNESDWAVIRDILTTHRILVAEPVEDDPRLQVFEHVLCVDRNLYAFTNQQACEEYIRDLNIQHGTSERQFRLGSMPFLEAVDISNINHMDLNIVDLDIAYLPKEKMLKICRKW